METSELVATDNWDGDDAWSTDSDSSEQSFNQDAYDKSYEIKAIVPVKSKSNDMFDSIRHEEIKAPEVIYKLYIQMSLCERSLRDYMQERNTRYLACDFTRIDLLTEFKAAGDLLCGIEYLHQMEFIHRDIKPENILYNRTQDKWQICDFGLARVNPRKMQNGPSTALIASNSLNLSTGIGTAHYSAPEQLHSNSYSYPVDIFAAGYVLFELFYIMSGLSERVRVFSNIRAELPERLPDNFINSRLIELIGVEQSSKLAHLITSCIQSVANVRPIVTSARSLLENLNHRQCYYSLNLT